MLKTPFTICLFLLAAALNAFSQADSLRARRDIDTLCSRAFAGRGYVQNGQERASAYIERNFSALAGTVGAVHHQPFSFELNVPQTAELQVGGKKYRIGKDFILNRFSGSGVAKGRILDVGYGLSPETGWRNQVVLLRAGLPDSVQQSAELRQKYRELADLNDRIAAAMEQQPAAILVIQSKLTASFSREQAAMPILECVLPMDKSYADERVSVAATSKMRTIHAKNISLTLRGTSHPDSLIYLTAHYDHIGMQGDALFAGANDNASGVSMLLEMARYYAAHPPRYTMRFVAFAAEECGLLGSKAWAEAYQKELSKVKFLLNMDLMGNGDKGITAVAGKDFPLLFEKLVAENTRLHAVPQVKARTNAPNSDHYWFVQAGVPAFFIYTEGGPPHYHDINDTPENLPMSRYRQVFELLVAFLAAIGEQK